MESCEGILSIDKLHIPFLNSPFYRILQKSAQLLCSASGVLNSGWLYLVAVVCLNVCNVVFLEIISQTC